MSITAYDDPEHEIVPSGGITGFGPDRVRCTCGATFLSTWDFESHREASR